MGKSFHVFVLLGDGELQEGTVWESALTTSTRGLSNVTAIIDLNKLQVEGEVTDIKQLYPLEEKWQSFGWDTVFIDGHNIELVASTLRKAKGRRGKPLAVIANTVKGKGVSFMEGELGWHKGELTEELYRKALAEIG